MELELGLVISRDQAYITAIIVCREKVEVACMQADQYGYVRYLA